jgi:aminoglycoside phosphotransferase (APT) family kinase protein
MSQAWTPAFPVDRALAAALIGAQFPALDLTTLEPGGVGWDHQVWRCDGVAFRFPHQQSSLTSGRDRASALAQLAPLLPMAVPEPRLYGQPTSAYPGHFVGYRWIEGELPARVDMSPHDRAAAAPVLARFLRALHGVSLDQGAEWGLVPEGERGSMADRAVYARRRAEQLRDTPFGALAERAASAMTPPPPECPDGQRRVVHGDLHAGQILMDGSHQLAGVIDWDALAIGDPAFDLILVFSFLPPAARPTFWSGYGPEHAAARARQLALSYGLALLAQGVETGDVGVRDEAAFSLENALS